MPFMFGFAALGMVGKGIYAPAFLCAVFCFAFTEWGWRMSCKWLQLPESFGRFKWWCAGVAFVIWAAALSVDPAFQAQQAKDKAARIENKNARRARAEAAEAERLRGKAAKAENEPFAHLFSAWDNSCRPLVAAVKANLKDPGSFEHIQTGFYRVNDVVHVTMTYRARNSFNGYAVGKATADVYADEKVANLSFD